MLNGIKMLFELRGFLSGYKTYLTAFAGCAAVAVQFTTGTIIPFIDGDVSTVGLINAVPSLIESVAPFVGIGTLRAGVGHK